MVNNSIINLKQISANKALPVSLKANKTCSISLLLFYHGQKANFVIGA